MGAFNVFWRDLLGRECCRRAEHSAGENKKARWLGPEVHIWAWFGEAIYRRRKWRLFRAACFGACAGRCGSWFRALFSSTDSPGGAPGVSLTAGESRATRWRGAGRAHGLGGVPGLPGRRVVPGPVPPRVCSARIPGSIGASIIPPASVPRPGAGASPAAFRLSHPRQLRSGRSRYTVGKRYSCS